MLIKYLYEYGDQKRPFGVIVALGPDKIGVALFNPKDTFTKKLGKKIAIGRAKFNIIPHVPDEFVYDWTGMLVHKEEIVDYELGRMEVRAEKYFKEKV